MRRPPTRALATVVAALAAATAVAGCSGASGTGASGAAAGSGASGAAGTTAAPVATRWWSDAAASSGSTIDPNDPTAAAAGLHPSATEYCGMLRATLKAGHSLFPGATSGDPALLTSTTAFVAELTQVAPADVSGDWRVLGTALLTLVTGASATSAASLDTAAVTSSAAHVAADAKTRCGLDLAAPAR